MSLPIKIVEDFNQPPEKNINKYILNQSIQKNNCSNFSFHESNLINSTISSSTLNKYSDKSSPFNISFIYNESFSQKKDNKHTENESSINLDENIIKKILRNSTTSLNSDEKDGNKIIDFPEARPCYISLEPENKNKDLNLFNNENIYNMYLNQNKIKNDISYNFNNCPNKNKNIKFKEIREYFKELKGLSDKIVQTLELIYKKNEFLLNSPNEIDLNNSEKNIEKNCKTNNKDIIINLINSKDKKLNINKLSSPKLNTNFLKKENEEDKLLDISNTNILIDKTNQEKKGDNYVNNASNNKNNTIQNKIKSLKRINNRKFNIKARGLRYNILTEEMKKQLLLDAMNMRTVEVAKKYGISTRNVNRWKKKGIQRKKGSGRKFKDPRLERKILEWYKMQDKETLTSRQFKEKAIELSDNKTFRASSGWLTNMKRKYNLNFKKY